MKLTAELSLYPLQEDYIPVIKAFIDELCAGGDVLVVQNAMATQLCGEYDHVFDLVREVLRRSSIEFGKQVLVCKFIPGELDIAG
ncbi:hypothetical protein EY643_17100 [Halioglobus maricola]|uniref:Thiamin/hydroxymethyl pyrimidine-binding YkoF putative domain-containing protein n=1 Tax=Halioglobus maricola TaxID=2601894 RepID=A0A5P9NP10_9GAMM|nr:YkoF family thiamine/hydroxymethylpyrimidine-binding protein [Halioglobus maricola]QFU77236.1 hypothetical protein EY643_17100 [Halioglobus maricola]